MSTSGGPSVLAAIELHATVRANAPLFPYRFNYHPELREARFVYDLGHIRPASVRLDIDYAEGHESIGHGD